MKIFHQILILILIGLTLYILRDDVITVYNKAFAFIASNMHTPTEISNESSNNRVSSAIGKDKDYILIESEDKQQIELKSTNTPGALRVTDSTNNTGTKSTQLSIKDVISWTNKNRTNNGNLPPLKENNKLDFSAQMKLDDMFKQQYFEHVSPDGLGVSDLGKKVSYDYIVIGENLALGNFKDSQALLDAWMASKGHRENILNNRYTDIGVAVGHGMFNGQDTWLAVQHFGLPRSACPYIDEVLHGVITLNQNEIKSISTDLNTRNKRIESGVVYEGKTTNEQITEYNTIVATYNKLIQEVKQKISDYNNGVKAFNNCLSNNTQIQG